MRTILVIDDEKLILDMMKKALTQFGYQVKVASDGQEGVNMFELGGIDLVITDIKMPNIDGLGVARHIRSSTKKQTPIIAISGTPWVLEEGDFDQVLAKPFPIKVLRDTVKNLAVQKATAA